MYYSKHIRSGGGGIKDLSGKIAAAVTDYGMIKSGDRIAVGLSGGKDSMSLALFLKRLSAYWPEKFDMMAVCIDMGFKDFDPSNIILFSRKHDIPLHIEKTHIEKIVFQVKKPKSSCSLCSNLRRGALNKAALSLGCNKTALGHHMDDAVETFFLSMLYEGRFPGFSPVTWLSRTGITVIRPMIYIEEHEVDSFAKESGIVPARNPCMAEARSRRALVKELLADIYKTNSAFKNNIFNTVMNSGMEGWRKPPREDIKK